LLLSSSSPPLRLRVSFFFFTHPPMERRGAEAQGRVARRDVVVRSLARRLVLRQPLQRRGIPCRIGVLRSGRSPAGRFGETRAVGERTIPIVHRASNKVESPDDCWTSHPGKECYVPTTPYPRTWVWRFFLRVPRDCRWRRSTKRREMAGEVPPFRALAGGSDRDDGGRGRGRRPG